MTDPHRGKATGQLRQSGADVDLVKRLLSEAYDFARRTGEPARFHFEILRMIAETIRELEAQRHPAAMMAYLTALLMTPRDDERAGPTWDGTMEDKRLICSTCGSVVGASHD